MSVTHFTQLSHYAPNDVDTNEKKQECFLNGLDDGLAYALEAQDFEKEFEALVKRLTARLAAAGFMKLLETIFGGTQFGSWLSSGFTGQAVNIKTPSVNTSLVPNTKTGTRGKAGQVMIPQIPSSSSVSISAPLYVTVEGNAGPDLEQSLAAAGARWQQQVLTVINQRFGRR